ncbi:hypothetical protein L798_00541 [Zootermopsis nevadensis]|uniref:LIM zinc-binding domain-containing protein n=1 Tax=Zootermopsis nevadensis TaxID=136037 RepID=A0A067QJD9_ZOONE|nr:hypothetical protein L798_00541 [Zootermopsis nevadensis]
MTAICFVCNLPILSHQVGLVWQGGNGWDDLVREQVEESTLRQRLGAGRRDSAAQITSISPPTETQETSPPSSGTVTRRRRSSLAQLTDILREWSGSTKCSRSKDPQLHRRETLADIAKSLPWSRSSTTDSTTVANLRKRRESSADQGIKHPKSRRDSTAISDFRSDLARLWSSRRESATVITARDPSQQRRGSGESARSGRRDSTTLISSRRGSGESSRSGRRDSINTSAVTPSPPKLHHHHHHHHHHHRRRDSRTGEPKYYRQEQRPSTSSTASDSGPGVSLLITQPSTAVRRSLPTIQRNFTTSIFLHECRGSMFLRIVAVYQQGGRNVVRHLLCLDVEGFAGLSASAEPQHALPPPTIITSSTTPPATSPSNAAQPVLVPTTTATLSSSPPGTTASAASATTTASTPVTSAHPLLATRRDSTTQRRSSTKEPSPTKFPRLPRQSTAIDESGPGPWGRRGSSVAAAVAADDSSGRKARRDSLSPDSASYTRGRSRGMPPRSPESSSTCSSRDPSPCNRASPAPTSHAPIIRRQSTTEEILIARGFRRQSTTEEMIRCRNFRRQSSQSEDLSRSRGRRDSSAQIIDGTFATMTVETTSTFFDTSTQTEPSPLYDNNHYHEECLRCNSCGLNLTGPNQKRARRFKNQILCDLHFADVALMECSDFMQQLRSFKPQSLGCAVARRKSSTTLIFPLPPQACSGE